MAINGNSLKVQIGKETTYGTAGTPTKQLKVASASLKPNYDKKDEGLLTGGKSTGKVATMSAKVEGAISTLARPDDVGLFIASALGVEAAVTPVENSTEAFKHTFTSIGTRENDILPALTVYLDKTTDKFSYTGCKINDFAFTAAQADYLKLDMNFVGKEEDGSAIMNSTLSNSPLTAFKFRYGKVYLGGAELADITNIKFNYNNNLDSSLQTTSTGLYFKEPFVGSREITTELEMLYTSGTEQLRKDYYKTDADVGIELVFTSDETIESNIPYSLKIVIPANQCPDADASFSSAETIKQTMNWKAFENGVDELITIELTNGLATKY